ncbi:MAG TPA: nucleoside triphosphate pyrophosphohydrolase [Gammaproteobacteria bacterium]|nr:nucleoside triphosphate pyrophosphohydrolase [Gammaproteobacteria bacterium]
MQEIFKIMGQLRDPKSGCPWDLKQNFKSIVPHTIEEAYEVADCIERQAYDDLPGELGDLLFQVVFYAQLGKEEGYFEFKDIVEKLSRKLKERHPHVFGDVTAGDLAEQNNRWEDHKARERELASDGRHKSELDGVPIGLPALTRATKLQKRASRVGFDWPDTTGVQEKVSEEFSEVVAAIAEGSRSQIEQEMGDLLFACVNWMRHFDLDPETALRKANRKFEQRFHFIEASLESLGSSVRGASLARMDELWEAAKSVE